MAASIAAVRGPGAERFHPNAATWTSRILELSSEQCKSEDFDFLEIDGLRGTAHRTDDANLVARHQQLDDSSELFRRFVCRYRLAVHLEDDVAAGNGLWS
jgi:hypothetical protein